MIAKFKQAASFGGGQVFSVGSHEVPAKVQEHWFFKHLVQHGLVVPSGEEDKPVVEPFASLEDRNKKMGESFDQMLEVQKEALTKGKPAAQEEAPTKAKSKK